MPAFTIYVHGGGPIIPGTLFPYLFITIACGAISGFHSLVSSGTTPKMLMKESQIKFIAVGAMLTEGIVSVLALIAAASLLPLDYFTINILQKDFNLFFRSFTQWGLWIQISLSFRWRWVRRLSVEQAVPYHLRLVWRKYFLIFPD